MAKLPPLELKAKVVQALPNAQFKLLLDNGVNVVGHISGKIRQNAIRILPGDTVKIEMSPYDLTKARIIFREKGL